MMISRRQFLRGRFAAPSDSASHGDPAAPKLAVIGPGCIAYTQNAVCRSCGDSCAPAAIRFSPRLGGAALPVVLTVQCTGCGDCTAVCPAGAIMLMLARQTQLPK